MKKLLTNQNGAALVTSVMLLSLLSIIGMSAMNNSDIELKIAGNERTATEAFYLAEAGIEHAFAQLKVDIGSDNFASFKNDYESNFSVYSVADSAGTKQNEQTLGNGKYKILLQYIDDEKVTLKSEGFDVGNSVASIEVDIEYEEGDVDPAFKAGILAHGSIGINGKSTFGGNMHTNSFIDIKNEFDLDASGDVVDRTSTDDEGNEIVLSSYITVVGDATKGKIDPPERLITGADVINVPSVYDSIKPLIDGSEIYNGNPVIKLEDGEVPPDDGEGNTYFYNGDLTISGDYSNITLIVNGTITHNGSAQLGGEGELTVAFISVGDITFNGSSSNTNSLFWTDGDYLHNGSSNLSGAVVARGTITSNGGLTYEQIDDFSDTVPLPSGTSKLSISSWRQP